VDALTETELINTATKIVRKFAGRFPPGVTAEDAHNDAVTLLIEHAAKQPCLSHLFTYSYGVLRDRYGRQWRHEYAHPSQSLDSVDEADIPDERAETIKRDVRDAADALPEKERTVILLTLDGLTQDQIAERLGVSQPYVSILVSSARKKMKATLAESYE